MAIIPEKISIFGAVLKSGEPQPFLVNCISRIRYYDHFIAYNNDLHMNYTQELCLDFTDDIIKWMSTFLSKMQNFR
jgi:hypothetical protein